MYVYCHNPELWRELCIAGAGSKGIDFCCTWKDTYARMTDPNAVIHRPIEVEGIYSELLYRSWACRVCDIDKACPGFFNPCTVERVKKEDLSVQAFIDNYESKNKPVIINGIVENWPAFKKWDWEYLESASKSTFRATSATASQAAYFSVSQYRVYSEYAKEEAPLYFFDRNFVTETAVTEDYTIPCYFDSSIPGSATDLFRLFGEKARPDYRWLIIGPKRSGSMFHIDPNQTNAWNAAIKGRKKWIFYPPGETPPGVMTSSDGAEATMPLSTGEWLLAFWPFHRQALKNKEILKRPLECILNPGELIFVPHNWWHMVINLDESIALTHNYVSSSNLVDCLYFLKFKTDQVSGLVERVMHGVANAPETIFDNFVEVLRKEHPELISEALRKLSAKRALGCTTGIIPLLKKRKKTVGYKERVDCSGLASGAFVRSEPSSPTTSDGKDTLNICIGDNSDGFMFSFM